ncbi:hypothetical protein FRB93_001246 [Tulasnella sp. JGI-2019a]|nr:hypothetical protein FRB93_001246 [Tulasnella sp. JGI-2019a]
MVGLPYGAEAEEALSAACDLKKVVAVAFDTETPRLDRIEQFLPSIISTLKTTAPRNMNDAKKRRQLGRKAAKEAQKTKASMTRREG